MAYTIHGHHIPGTDTEPVSYRTVNCGGPERCATCSKDAVEYQMLGSNVDVSALLGDDRVRYQDKAMQLVRDHVDAGYPENLRPKYDIFLVWSCKTLQNWKAIVGTTMPDGQLFELTHNGDKKETYLDEYTKIDNVVIPD